MDPYTYRGASAEREPEKREAEEPIFRSDAERASGAREAPTYEIPGRRGGAWETFKHLVAPLAALGLLLVKFKGLLLLLLKVKFIGTAVSMVLSVGAYALLFPAWFAIGLVALIWVHEMGHVLQLRREGIRASAPMFIPFLGAFVAMKEMPKDALAEARVGLAGPVLGTVGALVPLGAYSVTGEPVWLGLAYTGFFLNLFNLLPVLPLDGGRAVGAMSPVFWLVGIGGLAALLVVRPNFLLILIALLGGGEMWRRWKARNTPEGQDYHRIEGRHRVVVGLVYFGLIAVLALLMSSTYVPDPASL
jgi:Zn-dependent protease